MTPQSIYLLSIQSCASLLAYYLDWECL